MSSTDESKRRLMGSRLMPGALGFAASISLIAGCDMGPDYDYAEICASKYPVVQRVDDSYCNGTRSANPAYGWYYQQFPQRSWDDDGYDTTPDLVVVGNGGRPVGGSFNRPQGVNPGRIAVAPPVDPGAKAAPLARSGSISRGGFGVARGGGSSGS